MRRWSSLSSGTRRRRLLLLYHWGARLRRSGASRAEHELIHREWKSYHLARQPVRIDQSEGGAKRHREAVSVAIDGASYLDTAGCASLSNQRTKSAFIR